MKSIAGDTAASNERLGDFYLLLNQFEEAKIQFRNFIIYLAKFNQFFTKFYNFNK